MTCQMCHLHGADQSAIVEGVYYKQICRACHQILLLGQKPSSGQASYNRQRDLEDHLADIAQPYVGGKPNPDFIRLYPDQASRMFTPEDMRRYG